MFLYLELNHSGFTKSINYHRNFHFTENTLSTSVSKHTKRLNILIHIYGIIDDQI